MEPTPRQALRQRRDDYLARISRFDSLECPEPVDRRVALVRRFLAGGDDLPPDQTKPGEPALHRPPLATGKDVDDAVYRRSVHSDKRSEDNRSDEADYDAFILPREPEVDLNRLTGMLTRAVELWRAGMPLAPEDVFDLRVAELPDPDDTQDAASKAWALLILWGYDRHALESMITGVLDRADWHVDQWHGQPDILPLRDQFAGALYGCLTKFLNEKRAKQPACPPYTPPQGSASATPPPSPPHVPTDLPPDAAAAIQRSQEALVAAFGKLNPGAFLADLRGVPLPEPLIVRLLLWLASAWDGVRWDWRPGFASEQWRLTYGYDPYPNEDGVVRPDTPPAQIADAQVGQDDAHRRWRSVITTLHLARFVGRLNLDHARVSEAALRLWAAQTLDIFGKFPTKLESLIGKPIDGWQDEGTGDLRLGKISSFRQAPWFPPFFLAWLRSDETMAHSFAKQHASAYAADQLLRYPKPDSRRPVPAPVDAYYWRWVVVPSTFGHILGIPDTADFHVTDHLRFLGLFRLGGRLCPSEASPAFKDWLAKLVPDWFLDLATAALLRFKYWVTDRPTWRSDEEEMTFWSENHQVLFASSEFIAGQWRPRDLFTWTGQDGAWHKERAAARLERWLLDRLRFGFAESNSPVYYNEHLPAIFNIVDWVEDERLRTLGLMVLDLLVFDVARRTCQGSFVAATSRVYSGNKTSGWAVSIHDFVEVLTGTTGDIEIVSEPTAIALATSRYLDEVPECLLAMARDVSVPLVDQSRTSIGLEEGKKTYGIGFETGEDAVFWWGHSAFFTDQTYRLSQSFAARWHLHKTGPFALFALVDNVGWRILDVLIEGGEVAALYQLAPTLGGFFYPRLARFVFDAWTTFFDIISSIWNAITGGGDDRRRLAKTMIEQELERLAIEMNAGSVNERELLYLWRSADAMLSSLVDERPGKLSFQKEVCIASLGQSVSVFVNKPPKVPDLLSWKSAGNLAEGLARGVGENFLPWKTVPGALDLDSSAMPETGELIHTIGFPIGKDAILGKDGPGFWFGQVSNPRVWQHENVAIAIYHPDFHQREISDNTHAYWPWDAFDEVVTKEASGGRWVFGRRDRRFPPRTPPKPDDAFRPTAERPWPSTPRRPEESGEGAGYVALFSARGMKTTPASPRGWGHKELIADGHSNIWITIVGDRATYGSFKTFQELVLQAELSTNVDDGVCSIKMPKPPGVNTPAVHLELSWDHGAKLDGKQQSTGDWPRFKLSGSTLSSKPLRAAVVQPHGIRQWVPWDDTSWKIQTTVDRRENGANVTHQLWLEHDFSDPQKPRRRLNTLPPPPPPPPRTGGPSPGDGMVVPHAARSILGKPIHTATRQPVGPQRRNPGERRLR